MNFCSRILGVYICLTALVTAGTSPSVFLIGNSLTRDTLPERLEGDIVEWHLDCGKSLPYLYTNAVNPCVLTSTNWPQALAGRQYDFLSLQPYYRSTLAEDVMVMSQWIQEQSNAVIIVHDGWADHARFEREYNFPDWPGQMRHSQVYYNELIRQLQLLHPTREFRRTWATEILAQVFYDIEEGIGPFEQLSDIYRDSIHVTHQTGRYLMHNAMRHALGQPRSVEHFILTPEEKQYLDGVLDRVLEPPVVQDDYLPIWQGQTYAVISSGLLLANDNGGRLLVDAVSAPTGMVSSLSHTENLLHVSMTNTPAANNSFQYSARNARGLSQVATAYLVPINLRYSSETNRLSIASLGTNAIPSMTFVSAPGVSNHVQYSEDLENWFTLETIHAEVPGPFLVQDPEAPPLRRRYYRLKR